MQASTTIFFLIVPIIFLAIGLLFLIRPYFIVDWLRSFARPIAGHANGGFISQKAQQKQATSRPIFIQILGSVFLRVGIWLILKVLLTYLE